MTNKNLFAIDDNDKSLQEPQGGHFGLNTGYIIKFEFNPNGGKDNTPANAVDIHIKVKDKEYRRRLFEPTDTLFAGGKQVSKGEPEYEDAYVSDLSHKIAVIKHTLKALGVSDEVIKNTSNTLGNVSIVEGLQKLVALAPANYKEKQVDIFLEYQWNIVGDNQKTYLEIPKNLKGGAFLVSHNAPSKGEWKQVSAEDGGIKYVDANGLLHPFERSANYMSSNKAKEQQLTSIFDNATATQNTQPVASTW